VVALGWRKHLKPLKTAFRIARNLTEIRTWYLSGTSPKRYSFTVGVRKREIIRCFKVPMERLLLSEVEAQLNIISNDSVLTAKKTANFTIRKINWLTLFKEVIAVCSENCMKSVNTLCGQNAELLNIEVGGTYSYRWNLKG
jgi:hypothetical protein